MTVKVNSIVPSQFGDTAKLQETSVSGGSISSSSPSTTSSACSQTCSSTSTSPSPSTPNTFITNKTKSPEKNTPKTAITKEIGKPGPFQIIDNYTEPYSTPEMSARKSFSNGFTSLAVAANEQNATPQSTCALEAPNDPPRRRYSCQHYTTCLDLAAALNWDSFTCRGCSGEVDQALLWRARQALKRDVIARSVCELPDIIFQKK